MQVPILNGIYTDELSDFRIAYPYNMVPVPVQQGISQGYLRPGDGIVQFAVGPGADRGGINWNGIQYRVMGTQLVRVTDAGVVIPIGTVTGVDLVKFDYSFDRLAVRADGKLYLSNGSSLTQITDADLGTCVDFIWVDGYFMSTDGQFVAVTDLTNPFSVNPLKYGSSEADPDPVLALLKLHNEPIVLNRYTIETLSNIGGDGFPFQRIDGALISKGAVGTDACCVFMDNLAFVGSGRNEPVSVYLAANGQYTRIATREIDIQLAAYTEDQLSAVKVESRVDKGHQLLYMHLPDKTLVYDGAASALVTERVWFVLGSGVAPSQYRARNLVWCYNKWFVGDPASSNVGYLTTGLSTHWGATVGWELSTVIVYNDGAGAIFHQLELVALPGRVALGVDSKITTQYSLDGETWSQPKSISVGKTGERAKRLVWLQQGNMRNWRVQKFNGTSDSLLSVARLEAQLEGLAV